MSTDEAPPTRDEKGRRLTPLSAEEVKRTGTPGSKAAADEAQLNSAVERDYSTEEDPVLRKGLGPGSQSGFEYGAVKRPPRPRLFDDQRARQKSEPKSEDSFAEPTERIANPFERLQELEARQGLKGGVFGGMQTAAGRVMRRADGTWHTENFNFTIADVRKYDREAAMQKLAEAVPKPPAAPPPPHLQMIDEMYGKDVDIEFKQSVSDYISVKEKAREVFREKLKNAPGKARTGGVLGYDVPKRDIASDYRMMVRQFGQHPQPQNAAEWAKFDTWEWKGKYIGTLPRESRLSVASKRLVLGGFALAYGVKFLGDRYLDTHQAHADYKHVHIEDMGDYHNEHRPPYRSPSR